MAKDILLRVVASVIAMLIVIVVVMYMRQRYMQTHPDGGCSCHKKPTPPEQAASDISNIFYGATMMPATSGANSYSFVSL